MIAREGWLFIIPSAILTVLAGLAARLAAAGLDDTGLYAAGLVPLHAGLTIGFAGLTIFIAAFFRDPERTPPAGEPNLVSPADGTIVRVGPGAYPGGAAGTMMISVFMSVFNVHVNRTPLAGRVTRTEHQAGKFINAAADEAPAVNERNLVVLATRFGEVAFCQVAGLIARRIVCKVKPGDELPRGARMGLIRFGSRVDVYVPAGWTVNVKPGDFVRAGESILAVAAAGGPDGEKA